MLGFKKIDIHLAGIALAATGVPIGMYLNQFVPIVKWAPIVFVVSILMIIKWKNLFLIKFISKNKVFNIIILFQLIMLLYGFNSDTMTLQNLSFHLYVLALCISLMTLPKHIQMESLPLYVYIMSLPCIFAGVLVCQLHWVSGAEAWILRTHSDSFYIEPFSVASGAMINMFAALCILNKNFFIKIFSMSSLLTGFYILFECDKRTPIVVFVIGMMYFLYCKKVISINLMSKGVRYFFILILIFIIAYITIPYVTNRVDTVFDNIISGIANILGDTSTSDRTGSGIIRYERRLKVYDYINRNFTLVEYILGGGYFIMWVDNPLLESYLDMGVIGVVMYFLVIIYYPFKIIKKRINNDTIILFGCVSLYAMLSIFNSGVPYMAIKYVPVCILAFCFFNSSDIYPKKCSKKTF